MLQVHSLIRSELFTECDLMFLFQIPVSSGYLRSSSSCLHLLCRLLVPSVFACITCFIRQFLRNIWPIQLNLLSFIVCRMFLCFSSVCNICSFFSQSVQLIFSILLRHQIAGLWRNFWSVFWSIQVLAPYAAVPRMQRFTSFFLKWNFSLLVKIFQRFESHLHHGSGGFNFTLAPCIAYFQATKITEIFQIHPFLI